MAIAMVSFTDFVRDNALSNSAKTAFVFLRDLRSRQAESITFGRLDEDAMRVAASLQRDLPAGATVLLLYPQGIEFVRAFVGCLYSGVIAVPAPLPDDGRPARERLDRIVEDAGVSLVLTDTANRPRIAQWLKEQERTGIPCIATDRLTDVSPADWSAPATTGGTTAFLQYTSGSTGEPKGVVVSHANLVANARSIERSTGLRRESRVGGWLPLYHDMGLVGLVLQSLYQGMMCVLTSPVSFVKYPYQWLRVMADYGINACTMPNFGYELCLRRITPEQAATLDLSRWRVAINGAEPVQAETLAAFAERFAAAGLRPEALMPCYGMAETTLLISSDRPDRRPVVRHVDARLLEQGVFRPVGPDADPARTVVGSGRPEGMTVRVVDPTTGKLLDEGAIGEIWVRGPAVGRGYWNRPELTERTFHAVIADDEAGEDGAGGFLRTGDLGTLHDGEVYVTGRLKDTLVIRGRNLYPQDVEREVGAAHLATVRATSAAFTVPTPDGEQIVVVCEVSRRGLGATTPTEVEAAVRTHISREFGAGVARVLLVRPGTVCRTSSGKIQRSLIRDRYLAGELDDPRFHPHVQHERLSR